jgi:hypothetical protein
MTLRPVAVVAAGGRAEVADGEGAREREVAAAVGGPARAALLGTKAASDEVFYSYHV